MTLAEEQQKLLIEREALFINAVEEMLNSLGVPRNANCDTLIESLAATLLKADPPIE